MWQGHCVTYQKAWQEDTWYSTQPWQKRSPASTHTVDHTQTRAQLPVKKRNSLSKIRVANDKFEDFARHCAIRFFQTQRAKVVLPFLSLTKQSTFCAAATGFFAKWHPKNERRNSILTTCHYSDLASASDWLKKIFNQSEAISSDASSLTDSRTVGCFPATWFSVEKTRLDFGFSTRAVISYLTSEPFLAFISRTSHISSVRHQFRETTQL